MFNWIVPNVHGMKIWDTERLILVNILFHIHYTLFECSCGKHQRNSPVVLLMLKGKYSRVNLVESALVVFEGRRETGGLSRCCPPQPEGRNLVARP